MEMSITLRKIDKTNWRECIALKVKEEQNHLVAANANTLAMAYIYPEVNPLGIYLDEKIIGLITHALDPDENIHYINRFMIDENYQGKGYGKCALKLLIKKLKAEGVKTLDIIHHSDNDSAIKLYNSLGFYLTEDKVQGDSVSRLNISAN
jgi:diamine N-acetyltransferase